MVFRLRTLSKILVLLIAWIGSSVLICLGNWLRVSVNLRVYFIRLKLIVLSPALGLMLMLNSRLRLLSDLLMLNVSILMPDSTDSTLGSIVGGAIPVVGGIVSGLINASNTSAQNAANRDWAAQQQQQQNAYNQAQWQRTVDYNSPANMMARYKAAGLNPNLIYGSATGNVAAPAPMSVGAPYQAQRPEVPDFSRVGADAVNAYNSTRLASSNVDNLAAQTTNTAMQTVLTQANIIAKQMETGVLPASGAIAAGIANTQADTAFKQATTSQIPEQTAVLRSEVAKNLAGAQFTLNDDDRQTALASGSLMEAFSRIALNHANLLSTQAQTSLVPLQAQKLSAEASNLRALTSDTQVRQQLNQMDLQLKQMGVQPHDSMPFRVLGTIFNSVLPGSVSRSVGDYFNPSGSHATQMLNSINDHFNPRVGNW